MDRVFVIGKDVVPARTVVGEGESLRWTFLALPGTSADVRVEVSLEGKGADVDIACLYLCPSDEHISLDVDVRHLSGGCVSRQLFKGIVGGEARASFDGLIYVARDAQKTEAYQESHSVLLSDKAVAESRPQLEIYADDVKCSHGATSGYLDPDELFYMQSRGIGEEEARRLQILAFVSPVLNRLPEELVEKVYDCLSEN